MMASRARGPSVGSAGVSGKNYVTPRGHACLKAELLALLGRERPEVVRTVAWAASNGDRSENGDYIYGKKRLREIDRRIHDLTRQLDTAEVVDPALRGGTDQVFFGATVVYRNSAGSTTTVTITGRDEAEAGRGEVSWLSPVACALMRRRVGDMATLATPAGEDALEIIEVRYEAAA